MSKTAPETAAQNPPAPKTAAQNPPAPETAPQEVARETYVAVGNDWINPFSKVRFVHGAPTFHYPGRNELADAWVKDQREAGFLQLVG